MSYAYIGTHQELYDLLGSGEKARIMRQLLYWMVRRKDVEEFLSEVKEEYREVKEFFDNYEFGWIYKKMSEFKREILSDLSEQSLRRKINELVKEGYLSQRKNPNYKWDRTIQYRVNVVKLEKDLNQLGYSLQTVMGRDFQIVALHLQNGDTGNQNGDTSNQNGAVKHQNRDSSNQNGGAIPEITNRDYSSKITDKDYLHTPPRSGAGEKKNSSFKNFGEEEAQESKSVEAEVINDIPSTEQHFGYGQTFRNSPTREKAGAGVKSDEGYLLPEEDLMSFYEAVKAYLLVVNSPSDMTDGRADSIAGAITQRVEDGTPNIRDKKLVKDYKDGVLSCYTVEGLDHQKYKEEKWLRKLNLKGENDGEVSYL